jgi:hypothetical protein
MYNSKCCFRWNDGEWTSKRTPRGRNAGLRTPRWNDGLWTPHDGRWTPHDGLWTPHDGRWTARWNAVRRTAWYAAVWRAARPVSRRDAAMGNARGSPPSLDESGNVVSSAADTDPFSGLCLRNKDNAYLFLLARTLARTFARNMGWKPMECVILTRISR